MISSELVLLGLLRESPRHGYEIKVKIKEILSLFAGLDLKSIYYPLKILEKKGLVAKRASKEGKRPQRFIYHLTPKGQHRFNELLTKSLLDFKRPQFSLDLSLYFLDYMQSDIAKRRLKARISILEKLSRSLTDMIRSLEKKRSVPLARIMEHDLRMVKTESEFLQSLVKTL
ncbi:MAG TPA: PadR family transcriptional regulator [Patescibacteria group bacterium]|nr:PadR family transcriptional regulator [Patescibacteria group bacterium]